MSVDMSRDWCIEDVAGEALGNWCYRRVDERDPVINYTGRGWLHSLVDVATSNSRTLSSPHTVNDSLSYTFQGVGISVFGTTGASSDSIVLSYTIDGSRQDSIQHPTTTHVNEVLFWDSGVLPMGTHTLQVNISQVFPPAQPQALGETLWLDYFVVGINSTIFQSPPTSVKPSTTRNSKVAPIVGGVVGGLVFILGLILAFVFYRRRNIRRSRRRTAPVRRFIQAQDAKSEIVKMDALKYKPDLKVDVMKDTNGDQTKGMRSFSNISLGEN